jgi:hypothetical protein
MSNKPITVESCQDVVETMLSLLPHNHHYTTNQIVWERGYLTGLIARMMMEDPRIRLELERRVEALRSKQ